MAPIILTEKLSKTFARGKADAVEAVRAIDLTYPLSGFFHVTSPAGESL